MSDHSEGQFSHLSRFTDLNIPLHAIWTFPTNQKHEVYVSNNDINWLDIRKGASIPRDANTAALIHPA